MRTPDKDEKLPNATRRALAARARGWTKPRPKSRTLGSKKKRKDDVKCVDCHWADLQGHDPKYIKTVMCDKYHKETDAWGSRSCMDYWPHGRRYPRQGKMDRYIPE